MGPLLVALTIPTSIKSQLQRICFGLPSIIWIEKEYFYLVLFPIGPNKNDLLFDVKEQLKDLSIPQLSLVLSGIGCSSKKQQGEIWATVQPSESLLKLQTAIKKKVHDLPLEKSTFLPAHVPLGHFEKIPDHKLASYLEANTYFTSEPFPAGSLVILSREKTASRSYFIEQTRFETKTQINRLNRIGFKFGS